MYKSPYGHASLETRPLIFTAPELTIGPYLIQSYPNISPTPAQEDKRNITKFASRWTIFPTIIGETLLLAMPTIQKK